jgi:hypothetical protein
MEMETGITMARQVYEQPLRESDAMRETEEKPNQPRPSLPKDGIRRQPRPFPRLQKLLNPVHDLHEVQTQRRSEILRKRFQLLHLLSPLTRNLFMRVTTKTKRASLDTATVMKSALARWWLVITTLVLANGSICLVSE